MKNTMHIITALIILAASCKKKAISVNKDYEGYWVNGYSSGNCNFYLEINKTSHAKYETISPLSDCRRVHATEGKAKIGNGILAVGLKRFRIEQPPTAIDTVKIGYDNGGGAAQPGKSIMKMKLNGLFYYKLIGK